jgi:hypothetical protein
MDDGGGIEVFEHALKAHALVSLEISTGANKQGDPPQPKTNYALHSLKLTELIIWASYH